MTHMSPFPKIARAIVFVQFRPASDKPAPIALRQVSKTQKSNARPQSLHPLCEATGMHMHCNSIRFLSLFLVLFSSLCFALPLLLKSFFSYFPQIAIAMGLRVSCGVWHRCCFRWLRVLCRCRCWCRCRWAVGWVRAGDRVLALGASAVSCLRWLWRLWRQGAGTGAGWVPVLSDGCAHWSCELTVLAIATGCRRWCQCWCQLDVRAVKTGSVLVPVLGAVSLL